MKDVVTGFAIALYRAVGTALAIGLMEILAKLDDEPLWLVPFVTSIVLAMALPDSDPAQPRSIIGGHIISCLAGIAVVQLMGTGTTSSALAIGVATLVMIASRTLHPPAGIDAFLIAIHGLSWPWVLNPVLPGALLLTAFAVIWRAIEKRIFLPGERASAPSMWESLRLRRKSLHTKR